MLPVSKENKLFLQGLFIWLLATMFYFFDNLLNIAPATIELELKQYFNLTNDQFGLLASFYLWPYGLMQIPVGLMMDRIGPRKLLTVAAILCGFGCFVFGYATSFAMACIGRALIGFGASFAVIGCTKIAAIWFPTNFALFFGLMAAVGMLGPVAGLYWVELVVSYIGWQNAFKLSALLFVGFCVAFYVFVKDKRPDVDDFIQHTSNISIKK